MKEIEGKIEEIDSRQISTNNLRQNGILYININESSMFKLQSLLKLAKKVDKIWQNKNSAICILIWEKFDISKSKICQSKNTC